MALKAVLFDFNGVIINDEPLHEQLIEQLLLEENLRMKSGEFRKVCLGRSDRACLTDLLSSRGRVVTENYLTQLILRKAQAYRQQLEQLEALPIYPGLADFLQMLQAASIKIGLVSGALRTEIELVLQKVNGADFFKVIVAGDDITASKPDPDGYLLALAQFNQRYPNLDLHPWECLVIEDTPAGILAARRAGMPVVGITHTYPMHMLQRHSATWVVDYFQDIDLERVQQVLKLLVPVQKAG
jgi:beta-phosphoglucomutase